MVEPHDEDEKDARAELVQVVLVVHRYLAQSDLGARERVDVRHDLAFLILESHRRAFRRHVAAQVCASVLSDVSAALPDRDSAAMLRSAAAHVGWIPTAGREDPTEWFEELISLMRGDAGTARPAGEVRDDPPTQPADGLLPRPRTKKGR